MTQAPDRSSRWWRWLPLLLLVWIAATWYVETRFERLVISDDNLATDGDFTSGLPGGPHWEYAGPGDGLWQPRGGVDGGAALRLGGSMDGSLRYRLPRAYRADGYFVGLCLRGDGEAASAPANAWVAMRRADMPRLQAPLVALIEAPGTEAWRCALEAVAVPFGLDELVLQVDVPAGSGVVWLDRVTIRPAVNPPAYRLGHTVLVVGWLVIGGLSLGAVWLALGPAGGAVTLSAAVVTAALALGGAEAWLAGSAVGRLDALGGLARSLANPLFEALRVFTGDRSWRVTGTTDVLAAAALVALGFIAAWTVMLRFRWTSRPWGRTLVYAWLFGLSVPAVRLLVHASGFGNLHWLLDPLASLAGAALGAVCAETVLRLILRRAV